MPEILNELPDGFTPQNMLDLRSDKRTRMIVAVLQVAAIIFFVPLFAGFPLTFRQETGFDPALLWDLGLSSVSGLVSVLVLAVLAFGLALVHESLHHAVLRLYGVEDITASLNRLAPKVFAAEAYLPRLVAIIVTATPFLVVSVVGVAALLLVPDRFVAWAFLPTVIHAVISASDFVVLAWLLGVKRNYLVTLLPGGWLAYGPGEPGDPDETEHLV
ncbi:MAG: DUF3267 domain-containing protein [Alkalispirochaeta sp.]